MNSQLLYRLLKRAGMPLLLYVLLIGFTTASAQERPPRPITVTVDVLRQLQFGSFIQTGNYGTITVDYNGVRTPSGSIIAPPISSSAPSSSALFLVNAEPGTLITIVNGPDAILTGSNGGTLTLIIGESSTRSPFVTRSQNTDVYIGGTLIVGPMTANPAGAYSGTFSVTFIQE